MKEQALYQKYQETKFQTASPARLTLMLYDGALRFGNLALEAIENQDHDKQGVNSVKLLNIVAELQTSLDLDKGGEIAANLKELYSFVITELNRLSLTNDPEILKTVLKIMGSLRDAWAEIVKQNDHSAGPKPSDPERTTGLNLAC